MIPSDITGLALDVASSAIFQKWEVGYTVKSFPQIKKGRQTSLPYSKA